MKRFTSKNKKLKERVNELEVKKAALQKQLLIANQKIKYLEKQLPKTNLKDINSKMKEATKQINEMTTTEVTVGAEIVSTIKKVSTRSENFKTISYWLGWISNCHIVLAEETGASSSLSKTGVDINNTPKSKDIQTPVISFLQDLEIQALEVYKKMLNLTNQTLEFFVNKKVSSKWKQTVSEEKDITYSQSDICSILDGFLESLNNSNIPHNLINQFFFQIFHYISFNVFNSIVDNPSLICFDLSIQLKVFVYELENWLTNQKKILFSWQAYKPQLQSVIDLSNLLVIEKSHLTPSVVEEAFKFISPLQIKFFLDAYEQFNANEIIPKSVLEEISKLAKVEQVEQISAKKVLQESKLFNFSDISYN